ncbi:hypothetical protein J6590_063243 [Homalodisca vitripennis]|nr:hypothetical protein J6590_063243 [Homalodisca vitripennis]
MRTFLKRSNGRPHGSRPLRCADGHSPQLTVHRLTAPEVISRPVIVIISRIFYGNLNHKEEIDGNETTTLLTRSGIVFLQFALCEVKSVDKGLKTCSNKSKHMRHFCHGVLLRGLLRPPFVEVFGPRPVPFWGLITLQFNFEIQGLPRTPTQIFSWWELTTAKVLLSLLSRSIFSAGSDFCQVARGMNELNGETLEEWVGRGYAAYLRVPLSDPFGSSSHFAHVYRHCGLLWLIAALWRFVERIKTARPSTSHLAAALHRSSAMTHFAHIAAGIAAISYSRSEAEASMKAEDVARRRAAEAPEAQGGERCGPSKRDWVIRSNKTLLWDDNWVWAAISGGRCGAAVLSCCFVLASTEVDPEALHPGNNSADPGD